MKITITTDDGTLIDRIDSLNEYDLTKPMGRASMVEDIKLAIQLGCKRADVPAEEIPKWVAENHE